MQQKTIDVKHLNLFILISYEFHFLYNSIYTRKSTNTAMPPMLSFFFQKQYVYKFGWLLSVNAVAANSI